jgi:hypothetical protein
MVASCKIFCENVYVNNQLKYLNWRFKMTITQDSRMTEDAKDAADAFLSAVVANDNEMVRGFLEMEPTLIYSRNKFESTAIHYLIVDGTPEDLTTLRAILEVAEQNDVLPDYNIRNNNGHNAYHALQVHVRDPLNHEFAAAIGIHLTTRLTGNVYTDEEYARLRAQADEYFRERDEREAQRQRGEDYFNGNSNHQFLEDVNKGARINTAIVDDQSDSFRLKDLFNNLNTEKNTNQINAEVDEILKTFSFSTPFAMGSFESEEFLILIPQALSNFFHKIYQYIFGDDDSL